jgi:hypothetical protein
MGRKISIIWKCLNLAFIVLGTFLLVTMPSSNEPIVTSYTYLFLTITFVVIGCAMMILPIILLFVSNQKRTTIQKALWILFIVVFNIIGSFVSYFWLKEKYSTHSE